MKEIIVTQRFTRDVQRIKRALKHDIGDWQTLEYVLELLQQGRTLPDGFKDHALLYSLSGFREFHMDGDWLVIYRNRPNAIVLQRTGTHGDLFRRRPARSRKK